MTASWCPDFKIPVDDITSINSLRLIYYEIHSYFCLSFYRVIGISVVFHFHRDAFDCTGGHLLKAYYIGLLTLLVVSIIMTAIIVYVSMQGTITNTRPRRQLSKLIYMKLAISFPELVWNILGTYWAFGKSSGCELHVVAAVKGAVLSGWVIAVIVIIGIIVVFDPLGGKRDTSAESAKRVWEARSVYRYTSFLINQNYLIIYKHVRCPQIACTMQTAWGLQKCRIYNKHVKN